MAPRLIIAEDNAEFSRLLAMKAEREGWAVTQCKDGVELLATLREVEEPALIVVDINMPDLDGIEVIRKLNQCARARCFRFCMMTGGDHVNAVAARMIAQAGDLSVCNSLYKPFSMDDFGALLAEQRGLLA